MVDPKKPIGIKSFNMKASLEAFISEHAWWSNLPRTTESARLWSERSTFAPRMLRKGYDESEWRVQGTPYIPALAWGCHEDQVKLCGKVWLYGGIRIDKSITPKVNLTLLINATTTARSNNTRIRALQLWKVISTSRWLHDGKSFIAVASWLNFNNTL